MDGRFAIKKLSSVTRLFLLKLIKLISFLKGLFCYFFKLNNNSFAGPPSEVIIIGFIDKNHLIHVKEPYSKLFPKQNLHTGGSFREYKRGVIDLVLIEDKVFIRKAYWGSIKNKMKFFNEIECLNKLGQLKNIPTIHFADYNNLVIYLEYIRGSCLHIILNSKQGYSATFINKLSEDCKIALRKIHKNNIAVIDIQPQNIIYNSDKQDVFFIDFADSICSSLIPGRYLRFLQKSDELYLSERVLCKLL